MRLLFYSLLPLILCQVSPAGLLRQIFEKVTGISEMVELIQKDDEERKLLLLVIERAGIFIGQLKAENQRLKEELAKVQVPDGVLLTHAQYQGLIQSADAKANALNAFLRDLQ